MSYRQVRKSERFIADHNDTVEAMLAVSLEIGNFLDGPGGWAKKARMLFVFSLLLTFVTGFLFVTQLQEEETTFKPLGPSAAGTITQVEERVQRDAEGEKHTRCKINYSYTVEETTYSGSIPNWAAGYCAIESGQKIRISYDLANPALSTVVDPAFKKLNSLPWWSLLIVGGLLAVSVRLYWNTFRFRSFAKRLQANTEGEEVDLTEADELRRRYATYLFKATPF